MLLRCWAKLVVTVVTREAGTTRQHHDVPLKEASLASRLCWSDLTIVLTALGNPIPFLYLCCLFLLISWTSRLSRPLSALWLGLFFTRLDQFHWLGITRQNSRASNGAFERHAFFLRRLVAVTHRRRRLRLCRYPSTQADGRRGPPSLRRHRWSSASANLSKLGQPAQVA